MVGINKPSLHFYTNQLVTYESYDEVGLINLSNRLRFDEREKWKRNLIISDKESDSLLMVIDKVTSNYAYWSEIYKEELGTFGIYELWRLNRKDLEKKEIFLRSKGFEPDWRENKAEKY